MEPARAEYQRLYEVELAYVVRTLRRLGVAAADIEDVAHDVFVVAFRKRDERDRERPVRPWLFGIAFRVVGNYRQKAHRSREVSSEHHDTRAAGRNPEQETADRELLLSAMDVLDLEHRAAVVLVDLEGLTGPDVAEVLGVPLNTVYSRVRNARSKLLRRVRELQGEDS